MKRIYVVEYSQLARDRIRQALAWLEDCQIIGEAEAANEGVAGVNDLDPDIVITDLLLRDGTGVDVVKRIRERHGPARPVIFVLTNRPNSTHRATLAAAGANGVFDKVREYGLLLDEVRDVA
jgi:DNA-binding NarL/FixJ family response regulator